MLLHLFVALFNNEPISREQLVAVAMTSPASAERRARYLTTLELIEESVDGREVMLTSGGLTLLRELLDAEAGAPSGDWIFE